MEDDPDLAPLTAEEELFYAEMMWSHFGIKVEVVEFRHCPHCDTDKPVKSFGKRNGKPRYWCKTCDSSSNAKRQLRKRLEAQRLKMKQDFVFGKIIEDACQEA